MQGNNKNVLKKEIISLQEFLMNSWPAKYYYFLDGWILRFTDGVTSRANSVFPIRYTGTQKTLEYNINLVEKAYRTYNLEAMYTIPEIHEPENLTDNLLKRGYSTFDHTIALGIKLEEIQIIERKNDFSYKILENRSVEFSEFLATFSKRNENEQIIIQEINQRILIPKKCYILAKENDKVVGTLFAVLVPQGYMYIGDVFVHPKYRRRNIATSLLQKLINEWILPNEVRKIWLQVEQNNTKALNLYRKFGMRKLYSYFYMKKA
jgi:ribosomal protein S18 acetylase RimI-like enzyme